MILCGIDYSMTSPAICVYNTNTPLLFDNCQFYSICNIKNKPSRKNIHYTEMKEYHSDEHRFDLLSDWALEVMKVNNVSTSIIEGYSFGSKSSRIFQIGENGGVLKSKIYKSGIEIVKIPPTEVKKTFHGKGNASKELMIEALYQLESVKIGEGSKSPIGDIVDSYAILYSYIKRSQV